MTKYLKQQALYDSAVQSLKALGLTPGDFCSMALATDICQFITEAEAWAEPANLEDVTEVFCGADMAYETLETQVRTAWGLIE